MEITIKNPSNLPLIDYRKIKPLQPDSYKDLTKKNFEKLGNSIKRHGWISPFVLWQDGEDFYTTDGHQRLRWLNKTQPETVEYPYLLIEAADKKEAAEILLAWDSRYGTNTQEGLEEFVATFEVDDEYVEEIVNQPFIFTEEKEVADPFDDEGIKNKNQYGVIVVCEGEGQQEEIFNRLTGEGLTCKIVVT